MLQGKPAPAPSTARSRDRRLLTSCAVGLALVAMMHASQAEAQTATPPPPAFQGEATVVSGAATITRNGPGGTNPATGLPYATADTINVSTPTAVINWSPSDPNGTGSIEFLKSDGLVGFFGSGNYTVLNRILPSRAAAIELNGTIQSFSVGGDPTLATGGNIWFFAPNGLIVGNTARISVGSLALTTADLPFTLGASGGLTFGDGGSIDFGAGPLGTVANSFVRINQGAIIRAGLPITNPSGVPIQARSTSNYVAVVAPAIAQSGRIEVNGSAALVGAEAASIKISGNLFDIELVRGADVATDIGIIHNGVTTGPAPTSATDQQRIYITALAKNDAMNMLLGGDIGFAPANDAIRDAAGAIILSAGYNIQSIVASTRPGVLEIANEPVNGLPSSIALTGQFSTLTSPVPTGSSNLTSRVFSRASGAISIRPGDADVNVVFRGDTTFVADGDISLIADGGVGVLGNFDLLSRNGSITLQADAPETGYGANPASGLLQVNGNLFTRTFSPANGAISLTTSGVVRTEGNLTLQTSGAAIDVQLNDLITGARGETLGGLIDVGGNLTVISRAVGASVRGQPGGDATGAISTITIDGLLAVDGETVFSSEATGGRGGEGIGGEILDAGDGIGGEARLTINSGATADFGRLVVAANGTGGLGVTGNSTGGTAAVTVNAGGTLNAGEVVINADGSALDPATPFAIGGSGAGGVASFTSSGTSVLDTLVVTATGNGVEGATIGGDGVGGIARVAVTGGTTSLGAATVIADSLGGNGATQGRGNGAAALAEVIASGTGTELTLTDALTLSAEANGEARPGAAITGGTVRARAETGATLSAANIFGSADARGSLAGTTGTPSAVPSVTGGTVEVGARGGTLLTDGLFLSAIGRPNAPTNPGDGGARGGAITLFSDDAGLSQGLVTISGTTSLNASGNGSIGAEGSTATGGAVTLSANGGALDLGALTLLDAGAIAAPGGPTGFSGIARGGSVTIATQTADSSITFGSIIVDVTASSNIFFPSFVPEPGQDPGDGSPAFGGSFTLNLAGGLNGGSLSVDASATGGEAGPTATGLPRFEAGDGRGGVIDVNVTGGSSFVGTLTLNADGRGGQVSSASSTLVNTALAGDGVGGTISFDITGGALTTPGFTTLSAIGTGSAGRVSETGLGTAGGIGTGGEISVTIDGDGASFSVPSLSLLAGGFGGAGDASFSSAAATAGGAGIGGSTLLTIAEGALTSSETLDLTLDAGGRGGIGGQNFGSGNAGAGGAGTGGRSEYIDEVGVSLTRLIVNADGDGGAGGLAGQESGYGIAYGDGAGGSGGPGIGGTSIVTLDATATLDLLAIASDGGGGDGGGGAIGGAGGAATAGQPPAGGGEGGVLLKVTGGQIAIGDLRLSSSADGGAGGFGATGSGGAGGAATGGAVSLFADNDGTQLISQTEDSFRLIATATGGAGGVSGGESFGSGASGADGGDATGGRINVALEDGARMLNSAPANFIASGTGGAASAARDGFAGGGSGGDGGDGIGGDLSVSLLNGGTIDQASDVLPFFNIDLSGTGAAGTAGGTITGEGSGDGGAGGAGGLGQGGNFRFDIASEGVANFSGLDIDVDGSGGAGADGGFGFGLGGDGGAGGDGIGGATVIDIAGGATGNLGTLTFAGSGTGATAGSAGDGSEGGGDGGAGGDGIGTDTIINITDVTFGATALALTSTGIGGRGGDGGDGTGEGTPGGNGGRGGNGTGGSVEFNALDSNFDFDTIILTADGVGANGGTQGFGTGIPEVPGVPGNPMANPPIPPVPPIPEVPAVNGIGGAGGDATAGRAIITNADTGLLTGPFTRNLGEVEISARSQAGFGGPNAEGFFTIGQDFAGRVEIADTTTVPGGTLTIDRVRVLGSGASSIGDEGFFLSALTGPITVDEDLIVNFGGIANFNFEGDASLVVGGLVDVSTDNSIFVTHNGRGEDADSIVAQGMRFVSGSEIRFQEGSRVRSTGTLSAFAISGLFAADVRGVDEVRLATLFNSVEVRDASVTGDVSAPFFGDGPPEGGSLQLLAGFTEGFAASSDIRITGTISATGTIGALAGGDIVVQDGARVLSDNRVEFVSVDDIIVESGAEVRAAIDPLPEFGYGSSGDPLGSPALLSLRAGGFELSFLDPQPLGSIIVAGTLSAPDRAINLVGDAIQADGGVLDAKSLFANVNNAPDLGVIGRDDDGQLRAECVEGNICLGDLANLTGILQVGPANSISIRATDVQVAEIDIVARDSLTIGVFEADSVFSASDSLRLTSTLGDVTLNQVSLASSDLGIVAGGSLLGSGALSSDGDVGITVGDSIAAASISAGGELTRVGDIGGEREDFFPLPGSFSVGSVTVGGGFALQAGGSIDIATLAVEAGSVVDLVAGGSAFLGSAGSVGQPVSIAIEGSRVSFGNLFATDTLTLQSRSDSIDGGVLGAASIDLDAADAITVSNVSGNLDADAGEFAQFGSINGSNASIEAGSIIIDNLVVGSATLNTGGSLILANANVGLLDATAGSFDIGTLDGGSATIVASGSGAIDLASIGTEGSLVLSANGITLGSATAGAAIDLDSTSFVNAANLDAGTGISIDAEGAVTIGTANAGSFIAIDAGSLTVASNTMNAGTDIIVNTAGDADLGTSNAGGEIVVTAGGAIEFVALTAGNRTNLDANGAIAGGSTSSGQRFDARAGGDVTIATVLAGQVNLSPTEGSRGTRIESDGSIDLGRIEAFDSIELLANGSIAVDSASAGNNFAASAGQGVTLGIIETLGLDDFGYGGSGYGDIADIGVSAGGAVSFAQLTSADRIGVSADGAITGGPATAGADVTMTGGSIDVGALRAGVSDGASDVSVTATVGDLAVAGAAATRDVRLTSTTGSITAGAMAADTGLAALFANDDVTLASVDAGQTIFVGNAAQLGTLGTTPSAFMLAFTNPQRIGGTLTATSALVSRGGLTNGGGIRLGAAGGMTLADLTASSAAIYLTAGGASSAGAVAAGSSITGIFDNGLVATSLISTGGPVRLTSSAGGFDIGAGRSQGIFEVDAAGLVEIDAVTAQGFESGYGGASAGFDVDIVTSGAISVGTVTAAGDVRLTSTANSVGTGALTAQSGVVAVFAATDVTLGAVGSAQTIFVGNASQLSTLGAAPSGFQLSFATPVRIGGSLTATGTLRSRGGPTSGGIRMASAGGMSLGDLIVGPANILLSAGGASTAGSLTADFSVDGIFDNGLTATGIVSNQGSVRLRSTLGGFDIGTVRSFRTFEVDAATAVTVDQADVTGQEFGYGGQPLRFDIDIDTDGAIDIGSGTATRDIILAGGSASFDTLAAARTIAINADGAITGESASAGLDVTMRGDNANVGALEAGVGGALADIRVTAVEGSVRVGSALATRDVRLTAFGDAVDAGVLSADDGLVAIFAESNVALTSVDAEQLIYIASSAQLDALGETPDGFLLAFTAPARISGALTASGDLVARSGGTLGGVRAAAEGGMNLRNVTASNGTVVLSAGGVSTGGDISGRFGVEGIFDNGLVASSVQSSDAGVDLQSALGGFDLLTGRSFRTFEIDAASDVTIDQIDVTGLETGYGGGEFVYDIDITTDGAIRLGPGSATGDIRLDGSAASGGELTAGRDVLIDTREGGIDVLSARATRDVLFTSEGSARLGTVRATRDFVGTGGSLLVDDAEAARIRLTATAGASSLGRLRSGSTVELISFGDVSRFADVQASGDIEIDGQGAVAFGTVASTGGEFDIEAVGNVSGVSASAGAEFTIFTTQGGVDLGSARAGLVNVPATPDNRRAIGITAFGNVNLGSGEAALDIGLASATGSVGAGDLTATGGTLAIFAAQNVALANATARDQIFVGNSSLLPALGTNYQPSALRTLEPARIGGRMTATGDLRVQGSSFGSSIAIGAAGGIALRDAISTLGSIRLSAGGASSARTLDANGSIAGLLDGGLTATSLFARQGGVTLAASSGGYDIGSIDSRFQIAVTGAGLVDIDSAVTRGSQVSGSTSPASIVLRSTGGGVTVANANSAQNIELTAQSAIAAGTLVAPGTVVLNAANGAVGVTDLRAGGAVDARGTALTIASGGGALTFANALASAGAIDIDIVGALTVTSTSATGAIALESDSDVTLAAASGGAGIEIDAGRNATLSGAVTATGLLDLAASGLATINGAATGGTILVASGDIAIGANGRLVTPGLLTLRDTDAGRPTFIGGTGSTQGYSLSAEEMLRLQANSIAIFGGRVEAQQRDQVGSSRAPDVIVGAFTLAARNGNTTGQIGQSGSLRIETPGKLRVTGAVSLTSLSSGTSGNTGGSSSSSGGNRFEIQAFEALEIDALTGSIDMRASGGALGGTLFLGSEDVIAASLAAIGDVGRATTTDAIDDRLATNDGPTSDEGVLRANGIEVSVSRGFFVQNTGSGSRFRDRRGLTVGSGGLRISTPSRDPSGSGLARIVINGRQVQEISTTGSPGFVTGVDFLRLVNINGTTGGGQTGLDLGSTINGCGIANPSACFDFDATPPLTDDIINQPLDPINDFDESALTGSDLPTTLIQLRDFEPFGFEPLIDEPVTGAGNDDLYVRDCEPGSTEPGCEAPPEG